MSIWDDPGMKVGGNYAKFDNIGDAVTGKVISVGAHRWDDGTVSPQILLETADGEITVTAGQVRLKAALAEQRPEVGDTLSIRLSDIEKRSGGKTLKHFDVKVAKGAGDPWASPVSQAVDTSGVDPKVLEALKKELGATPVTPF